MHAQNTPPLARKKPAAKKPACLTPVQIADRLHNSACQSITGARLLLHILRDQLPQDSAEVMQQFEELDGVLDVACAELRALVKELRSAAEKDTAA